MIRLIVESLLAYTLADLLTGIYHFVTDRGWNVASQVALFQQHHDRPAQLGVDLSPAIAGIPLMALALLGWHPVFFLALGTSVTLAQVPHYWAHHRGNRLVRFLQRLHLLLPPRHHARHHHGEFDRNYCVLSGWNNFWLNWVVRAPAQRLFR
jgi:plasmanylethanolamine desaturase